MSNKQQLLTMLREELFLWNELLAGLSEEQLTTRSMPADLSIKDVVAHLATWQQRSIARVEAARNNTTPDYSGWPADLNPEAEEDLEAVNAWIHETHRDQPWTQVYQEWNDGFVRLIEISEPIPDHDLYDATLYPWLDGYSVADVLEGTYEHHHIDHYEPLVEWLRKHPQL